MHVAYASFLVFFFFFFVGWESYSLHIHLQATLTTWVEADTQVCKEATCQAQPESRLRTAQQISLTHANGQPKKGQLACAGVALPMYDL